MTLVVEALCTAQSKLGASFKRHCAYDIIDCLLQILTCAMLISAIIIVIHQQSQKVK